MPINNRGLAGQPGLPYFDYRSYAGVDVFLDLTFLDYTGTPQIPSSITYQVDDLSNNVNMIPPTTVVPTASSMTIQLRGLQMAMTNQFQGSQICQFTCSATLPPVSGTVNVPLASNISLLLHGDATPLIDSSNYANPMTANNVAGSPPVFETGVVKFGPGAINFPSGNTTDVSQLYTPIIAGSPLDILTSGDFTIDGWFNLQTNQAGAAIIFDYGGNLTGFSQSQNSLRLTANASNGFVALGTNLAGWSNLGGNFGVVPGTWYYFALVRKGVNAQLFVGTTVATVATTPAVNWTGYPGPQAGSVALFGYSPQVVSQLEFFYGDEIRVIKGTALYDPAATSIVTPTVPVVQTVIPASPAPVVKSVTIIELVAIQTPGGTGP